LQALGAVQAFIPAHLMLPVRRLEGLVEQALEAQLARCLHHASDPPRLSLLSDLQGDEDHIPTRTVQVRWLCLRAKTRKDARGFDSVDNSSWEARTH
jgi:hypothetical protein